MAEISKNAEVNREAWQLYAQMKADPLNQAIGNIGNPDFDPNDPNSSQTTQTS